jgi:hypothetical protein
VKVEDCIVSVERRTLGRCVDLAFVFSREFYAPILRLWLLCAGPACGLVWCLACLTTDMLLPSLLIFLVFGSIFSALLTACLGPQVFGVPISVRGAVRAWRKRFFAWFFSSALVMFFQCLAGFCFVLPAVFVTAIAGHLPEVLFLENTPLTRINSRLTWLAGGGGYRRNLGRLMELFSYWSSMSLGIFVILDLLCGTILNKPIFLGRVFSDSGGREELVSQVLLDDPLFLTGLQLCLWIPYPLIRIAWFFCYLDQRIRSECWDLQVVFQTEAHRLEELA